MSVCVGFTNSHIKKSLVEHKRAVAAVAWRVVHLSLVGTPRDNLVCQWVFDSPMWVVHIKTFLVAAAVAWRVGHVETIQTWGRLPVITLQHTLPSTIQCISLSIFYTLEEEYTILVYFTLPIASSRILLGAYQICYAMCIHKQYSLCIWEKQQVLLKVEEISYAVVQYSVTVLVQWYSKTVAIFSLHMRSNPCAQG